MNERAKKTHSNYSEFFENNYFEQRAWDSSSNICGIDEVGRGCMAGPIVTAAVVVPPNTAQPFLKDSKLLTAIQRKKAALWIQENCLYSYGIVHHRIVDQCNVWHATLIAMKKAALGLLGQLPLLPAAIVVDAMPLSLANTSYHAIPIHYFPFGESKSMSIAAASIIAKVKRDTMMQELAVLFPGYYLDQHKGYCTPQHKKIVAYKKHACIYRLTYLKEKDER